MKVTVLCSRSICTPPHPCGECSRLAAVILARISDAGVLLAELPADRTIVIQTGAAVLIPS